MDMKKAFDLCLAKTQCHMKNYKGGYEYGGASVYGKYEEECARKLELDARTNWMTSFVTGMGVLAYRTTKEKAYFDWVEQYKQAYHDKVYDCFDTSPIHDLGFLYSPYCVAMYKETGDESYKLSALRAADELTKRFDFKGKYIDAWTDMTKTTQKGRAIVDSMMNLPLLFWAWKETGQYFYYQVAKSHMETTMKYFIREDDTVAHSFEFDRATGEVICESNTCGYANGSYWARGTSWAIYGFAIAARYLDDDNLYALSARLLDKFLKTMPEGTSVPPWDFRLPKEQPAIPTSPQKLPENHLWDFTDPKNCKYNVDTSAPVIAALGALELNARHADKKYTDFADSVIAQISAEYLNDDPEVQGLMKNQNGQNLYATYGDYYFFELLSRRMFDLPVCW